VFLQRSWSAVKNSQAEDRLHRIGQESAVTIIDLVSQDTIEDRVREVLTQKGEMLEEIARDAETVRLWLQK
jgi:SNF2 family DNA or RNA helicase